MSNRLGHQQGKIKALYVAANPTSTDRLKLDEEIRAIAEKIRASEHRDLLEIVSIWAVRPDDLLQSLNMHKPQIVHFSGHGSPTGEIILVDQSGLPKPVSTKALKALFTTLRDNVRVVILNACYSQLQARAITEIIDCAIGMNDAIGDQAAITFAASFYRAIGFGRSIQEAFEQGKIALLLEGISEDDTPELLVKTGIDSSRILLVAPVEDITLQEGKSLLKRGQNALLRNDYVSGKRDIEKAMEMLREDELPNEAAQVRYLLALAQFNGKRPFVQTHSAMSSAENLIRAAIELHPSYAYHLTLALFKLDFARNGLPHLAREARELLNEADQLAQTPEDEENLKLLSACQPHLIRDFLSS